jgi:hypothetical protein
MAEIVANEDLLINPNDVYSLNEKISYFLNSDSSEIVAQISKELNIFLKKFLPIMC